MKAKFLSFLDDVRTSYWFIPTLMAVLALVLSLGVVQIDSLVAGKAPSWLSWLFTNQPDGARAVLSTIAGSMITVAGVVFSITLVSVSNAAFQFGPRLLTNFMRDRTNQITLGTFIATFLYCLMVLRAVQSVPPTADKNEAALFVPHIAILVALVLAVCSIIVLIRFIHHVPQSIHVSNLLARIGEDFADRLDNRFPNGLGQEKPAHSEDEIDAFRERFLGTDTDRVLAQTAGYIRLIDAERLIRLAQEKNLYFLLERRPGDFVAAGDCLMKITGGSDDAHQSCARELSDCVMIGSSRTPMQDIDFLAAELSEIAMRALSPGINDPQTAITAVNWLFAGLTLLSRREGLSPLRADDEKATRVLTPVTSFDGLLESCIATIAPDFARNVPAAAALDLQLSRLRDKLTGKRRQKVRDLQEQFHDLAWAALTEPEYIQVFGERPKPVENIAKKATSRLRNFLSR